jgi:hypothetical protein
MRTLIRLVRRSGPGDVKIGFTGPPHHPVLTGHRPSVRIIYQNNIIRRTYRSNRSLLSPSKTAAAIRIECILFAIAKISAWVGGPFLEKGRQVGAKINNLFMIKH